MIDKFPVPEARKMYSNLSLSRERAMMNLQKACAEDGEAARGATYIASVSSVAYVHSADGDG
jgi:hypothetical protein